VHHKNLGDSKNICHFEFAKSEIFNAQSGARGEGIFCMFGWEMPIHAPKIWVIG